MSSPSMTYLICGGNWDDPIDQQHFEVGGVLAERLLHATPAAAHELFAQHAARYLKCRREKPDEAGRSASVAAEIQIND